MIENNEIENDQLFFQWTQLPFPLPFQMKGVAGRQVHSISYITFHFEQFATRKLKGSTTCLRK
jgi:hypothetical protein